MRALPSSRHHFMQKDFQADMVIVCHFDRAEELKNTKDDWLVESAMVADELTKLVMVFTQGDTDAKDVKKFMELDAQFPAAKWPNKNRHRQEIQMYGIAYSVLDDAKMRAFSDIRTLPQDVMDRVDGLLPKEAVDRLIKNNAQLYMRAKPPKLRK